MKSAHFLNPSLLHVKSVYWVDRCFLLFHRPPLYPEISLFVVRSCLPLDLLHLSIRPSSAGYGLHVTCVLLQRSTCMGGMKSVMFWHDYINLYQSCTSSTVKMVLIKFHWPTFFFLFCLMLSPHTVPVEPCPSGQRGAASTTSPTSCQQVGAWGLPPPTLLCSPQPARQIGQQRGWCGCRQRNMALRWALWKQVFIFQNMYILLKTVTLIHQPHLKLCTDVLLSSFRFQGVKMCRVLWEKITTLQDWKQIIYHLVLTFLFSLSVLIVL